jgi:hypothetical protein
MATTFAALHFDINLSLTSGSGPALLVLVAFLLSFGFIRTSARLMRSPRVPWWPGSVTTESGLHIHHLVWGIALLLLSGFVAFASELEEPWKQITAIGFGIGAGLTLDEFALWLHLEDVYWTHAGRSSVDAVVLATVFAVVVLLGVHPVDSSSVILGVGAVILLVTVAAITFLKGRFVLGIVALHILPIGIYTAMRLGTPDSAWARWRYRGEKLERAERRFPPDRPWVRRRDRLLDLIAGAPSHD